MPFLENAIDLLVSDRAFGHDYSALWLRVACIEKRLQHLWYKQFLLYTRRIFSSIMVLGVSALALCADTQVTNYP